MGVPAFCRHGVLNLVPFWGVPTPAGALQALPTSMWVLARPCPVPSCPWPELRSFSHTLAAACGSWPFGVAAPGSPPPPRPRQLSQCPATPPSPCLSFPPAFSCQPLGAFATSGGTHGTAGCALSRHPCPGTAPRTHPRVSLGPGARSCPWEGSLAALPGVMLPLGTGIYLLAQLVPINKWGAYK